MIHSVLISRVIGYRLIYCHNFLSLVVLILGRGYWGNILKLEITMTKTFSMVYENDSKLETFLQQHCLKDGSNLLIQVISEQVKPEPFYEKLKKRFPTATITDIAAEEELQLNKKIFLSFTLIEETVLNLFSYDSGTGIANKMKFMEKLEKQMSLFRKRNEPLALLIIDIDRFRTINDNLGYDVGDYILREMAFRLKDSIPQEAYFGTISGGKFSLLLTKNVKVGSIRGIANQLLENIAIPFFYQNQEIYLTGSIGISLFPSDGLNQQGLLKHADTAVNRSKQLGGNRVCFYSSKMNRQIQKRFKRENFLRKALCKQELFLCYQPLMELKTGVIVGNEALLRWNHPQLGLVAPSEFIPLAEELGIIDQIGAWALKSACEQTKKWQMNGFPHLGISVNVSAQQFQKPYFYQQVLYILHETGIAPHDLTLELTETTMLQRIEYSKRLIGKFQRLGVRISMDDFGTGYSSLSYLRSLPINSLKIDRSFVKNLHETPIDMAIMKSIISLAEGLNIDLVAEGVETKEQAILLRDMRCDYAQGYYIQKPLPPHEYVCVAKRDVLN